METITDNIGRKYQQYNGTCYHADTTKEIIMLLERIRFYQIRVRLHWGDIKTGRDWCDDLDCKGRLGRSTGSIKIPILLYNSRSMDGGHILDHCIVKIMETKGGKVLYCHPEYHV